MSDLVTLKADLSRLVNQEVGPWAEIEAWVSDVASRALVALVEAEQERDGWQGAAEELRTERDNEMHRADAAALKGDSE